MTYPDARVVQHLNDAVVPFKPELAKSGELAGRFGVFWTPGLLWLDKRDRVMHQNVGFFRPEEWLAECMLGCGKVAAGHKDWAKAREWFDRVLAEHPDSYAAPAASYWSAVAGKMATGEVETLLTGWRNLQQKYADSAWAMKVEFLNGK